MTGLWPIAVFEDRYSGTYSGGDWVAMGRSDQDIARKRVFDACNDGDFECGEFWTDERKALCGQGETASAAVEDLERKAASMGEGTWWPKFFELFIEAS